MAKLKNEAAAKRRIIKLYMTPEDHVRVRLAAVVTDQAVTEFCRDTLLSRSREITKDIPIPTQVGKGRGTTE